MAEIHIEAVEPGIFHVVGDLRFDTAERTLELSSTILQGEGDILINLDRVARVDSAGLACLIEWVRCARKAERNICFEQIHPQLSALIRLSGLEKVLPVAA